MSEVKNETVEKKSIIDEIVDQPFVVPFVNIFESDDEFRISADIPGVSKENLEIKVEDNFLMIVGKVNFSDELKRKYLLKEKKIGNYFRKFKLSDTVDVNKISAKLENGQLEIFLSKKESLKPRSIQIL